LGLEPGIYEYLPSRNELAPRSLDSPLASALSLTLPEQRLELDGFSFVICLVGSLPRIQKKYGQGAYRSLAMEAGHISANLILSATALGIAARPVDSLIERNTNVFLGLCAPDEQFMLSLWVGWPRA